MIRWPINERLASTSRATCAGQTRGFPGPFHKLASRGSRDVHSADAGVSVAEAERRSFRLGRGPIGGWCFIRNSFHIRAKLLPCWRIFELVQHTAATNCRSQVSDDKRRPAMADEIAGQTGTLRSPSVRSGVQRCFSWWPHRIWSFAAPQLSAGLVARARLIGRIYQHILSIAGNIIKCGNHSKRRGKPSSSTGVYFAPVPRCVPESILGLSTRCATKASSSSSVAGSIVWQTCRRSAIPT